MTTIFYIVGLCTAFSAGYFVSSLVSANAWLSRRWKILRWDENILGYRVTPPTVDLIEKTSVIMMVEVGGEVAELLVRE